MKRRYQLYLRGTTWYCEDTQTGKQETLRTKDRETALRLVNARNEAQQQPAINLQIARAYISVSDPAATKRSWRFVMDEMEKLRKGPTLERWQRAMKDKAFDSIRDLPILETRPEHFLRSLREGTVATNLFLRRLNNFAMDMNWLPWPLIPKRQWPKIRFKEKRAITWEEHQAIIARETNPERRAFYQLEWHIGASQSDLACLEAKNIDWENQAISFPRKKTGSIALLRFGDEVAKVLRQRPEVGPLFPHLRTLRASDRATEFKQRCQGLKIKGVTLHSYRYAWAERAKEAGYPERYAQEALGHNSKSVHRAYAGKAKMELPPLEDYESARRKLKSGQPNVVTMPADSETKVG